MSGRGGSWGPETFDRLYAADPDPWGFATSEYERGKYDDTLARLGPHYASALELGCSIGVLSERLAARCERLLSLDLAEAALLRARTRCAALPQLEFRRAVLPRDWPEGRFDLILVSELLYFLSPDDIATLARQSREAALPTCTVLLVNWTGSTDTPTSGEEAAELFRAGLVLDGSGFRPAAPVRQPGYRLDLIQRP